MTTFVIKINADLTGEQVEAFTARLTGAVLDAMPVAQLWDFSLTEATEDFLAEADGEVHHLPEDERRRVIDAYEAEVEAARGGWDGPPVCHYHGESVDVVGEDYHGRTWVICEECGEEMTGGDAE